MARVRQTAKDHTEAAASHEEEEVHSGGEEESLSGVDADPSELMGKGKPPPTLRFGLWTFCSLPHMMSEGTSPLGLVAHLRGKRHPIPRRGNVWFS